MKKYILIILFIFNSTLLFSDYKTEWYNFINYSFSKNISDGNINHAISTDFIIDNNKFLHNPGIKYVFGDNIVNIQYSFIPVFYRIFNIQYDDNKILYDLLTDLPYFGIGANISYNINNHIFGISPEINITKVFFLFHLNLAYKYNINFNYNNSFEIVFTIKFIPPWTFIKMLTA
jgi:hypothetical protein